MNECGSDRRKLDRPVRADAQEERGLRHLAARRYDAAVNCFTAAIKLDPTNAGYFAGRALAHAKRQDHELAIEDFTTAIGLDPGYAAAYNGRALVYSMTGDYDSAIEDHDEAVRLDPGNERARLGMVAACLLSDGRDLTPEDLMRARRDSSNPDVRPGNGVLDASVSPLTLSLIPDGKESGRSSSRM